MSPFSNSWRRGFENSQNVGLKSLSNGEEATWVTNIDKGITCILSIYQQIVISKSIINYDTIGLC